MDTIFINNDIQKKTPKFFKNFFYININLFNLLEKLKFINDYIKSKKLSKYKKKKYRFILFKNYRAIHLAKNIANDHTKIIYLCSGFILTDFISYKNYNILSKKNIYRSKYEKYVFKNVDQIIVNSDISKRIIRKNYEQNRNIDIVWTSTFSFSNRKIVRIEDKKYDIIFSCSNFEREEKNSKFFLDLLNILNKNLKILIIGNNQEIIFRSKNIIQKNYLTKRKFDSLLHQTKIVLIPSKFDSSPNLFFESFDNNCIPLVSKNCGIPSLFRSFQISTFDLKKWSLKIIDILDNYQHEFNKNKLYKNKIDNLKKNN